MPSISRTPTGSRRTTGARRSTTGRPPCPRSRRSANDGQLVRALVTGGSGFIGSHVVDKLIAAGHEARILDLAGSPWHDPAEVETIVGDLTDAATVREALDGCDAIFHLAAMADVNEVVKEPVRTDAVNTR